MEIGAQTVHSSKMFHYDVKDKTFSVEISQLSHGQENRNIWQRIYDDACDSGFAILSEVTGKIALFVINRIKGDNEGEVQYWELIPTRKTLRELPALNGVKVVVFND